MHIHVAVSLMKDKFATQPMLLHTSIYSMYIGVKFCSELMMVEKVICNHSCFIILRQMGVL